MTKSKELEESLEEEMALNRELSELQKMEHAWMKKTAWRKILSMSFWVFGFPLIIIAYVKLISLGINLFF